MMSKSVKRFALHTEAVRMARAAAEEGRTVHMKQFTKALRNDYVDAVSVMEAVRELASGSYVEGCSLRHVGRGQYELVEFAPKHEVTTVVVLSKDNDNAVVDVIVFDGRIIEKEAIEEVRNQLVKSFVEEDTDCTPAEWRSFVREQYELVVKYSILSKF